jgi:hypothetical protein
MDLEKDWTNSVQHREGTMIEQLLILSTPDATLFQNEILILQNKIFSVANPHNNLRCAELWCHSSRHIMDVLLLSM